MPTIKGLEDKFHCNFEVGSKVHHWVQRCKLELYNTKSVKAIVRLVRAHVKGHVATRLQ
jgi:hypothetical protein